MVTEDQRERSAAPVRLESEPREAISGGTGVVSLLLLIHLVCVGIALSSNLHRSTLQARLMKVLQPYLGLVNLDPDFTPYHLTQGQPLDDDHFLEIELVAERNSSTAIVDSKKDRVTLEGGNRWGFARRRYRRLAYAIAYHARAENDHLTAALARAAAGLVLEKGTDRQAIVRCQQHESQPRRLEDLAAGFPENPADAQYHRKVYEADVWFAEGLLRVQKRVTDQEAAQLERAATEKNQSPADPGR
ncbi:MAG TPA: hypothetical protein EYN70_10445 [Planctomycetaceae bacterium]|nr:hypothetical protein [Planctomycetaceae bacterium]